MKFHGDLTIGKAISVYPLTLLLMLLGSAASLKVFGYGWALWANQGVLLVIATYLARKNKWSWKEVYRFRRIDFKTVLSAILMGFGLWWGGLAFNIWSERLVIRYFGSHSPPTLEVKDIVLMVLAMTILAPIIEEVLFRGYFLRAFEAQTKKPWLWSGLLFGVMHIGNGLSSTIPATIYGFVFGYIVWKCNSIIPGIIAHMCVNLNGVFLGGIYQNFVVAPTFKPVLLAMSLNGLILFVIGFIWFRHLQSDKLATESLENSRISLKPIQWSGLVLSVIILIGLGVSDAIYRVETIDVSKSGYTSIKAGKSTNLRIAEIEVDNAPAILKFNYTLASEVIDAQLVVLNPDEDIVWSKEIKAYNITIESAIEVILDLDKEGVWVISIIGNTEKLTFDANWEVISK